MNCKDSTNNLNEYYKLTGIDGQMLEKTKNKMKMFLTIMESMFMANKVYAPFRGKKYSCIEDIILHEGLFFDSNIESVSPTIPLIKLLKMSQAQDRAYCEGFILPWTGGTPIQAEWVYDAKTNTIFSRENGLHFGVAFNPAYLLDKFPEAGLSSILSYDMKHEKLFMNHGFPKEALIDNHK